MATKRDEIDLERLDAAIASLRPSRRSFTRMRTEDPDPEVDPFDPPTQPERTFTSRE